MSASSDKIYFSDLNTTLRSGERALPILLIDLDRLDANIDVLIATLKPDIRFRIVVKSLPSFPLLQYILLRTKTSNLMVFHQPFLTDLSSQLDGSADVLLGKPLPFKTAKYYYDHLPPLKNHFDPYRQIQWLVDTKMRLSQYANLASGLGKRLRVNLEIDVGLHRGGFDNLEHLRLALNFIREHTDHVEFSGLMGYDPHVAKIPRWLRSQQKSMQSSQSFYRQCIAVVREEFPQLWNQNLTFNGGGSPTIHLHSSDQSPLNDISAGSCLVMPTTFDLSGLESFQPACFIATPILKALKGTTIPGLERAKGILNLLSKQHRKSFFIYGGNWKADYYYPKGIRENKLFGSSSNQSMVNAPGSVALDVDDYIFLRPQQSEFVFLQFGKIVALRKGKIIDHWEPLRDWLSRK